MINFSPGLYIVSTPIGNLGDITSRALEVLKAADKILAEDTRHTKNLLDKYSISAGNLESCHNFNESSKVDKVISLLQQDKIIALVSDAGTPIISDPGNRVVRCALRSNLQVIPLPGACALIAALSVSGLCDSGFSFFGFLPAKQTSRKKQLLAADTDSKTMVFYEAPHRLAACIDDMTEIFGADREITIAREITKMHESIVLTNLGTAKKNIANGAIKLLGEIVLVVAAKAKEAAQLDAKDEKWLRELLPKMPATDIAKIASKISGLPKSEIYNKLLTWKK